MYILCIYIFSFEVSHVQGTTTIKMIRGLCWAQPGRSGLISASMRIHVDL